MQADFAEADRRFLRSLQVSRAAPAVAAVAATGVTLALFWPGFMSWDSVFQLTQARFGVEHNSHPPLMSYIWRPLDRILPGPGLMLLLQALLFWGGLAAFLSRVGGRPIAAALVVLALALFPPLQGLLGVVWKDVGMMAFFMAAVACLAAARPGRDRAWIGAGLVLTFAAVAYRHNAAAAAVPLWLWAGWLLAGPRRLAGLAASGAIAATTLAGAYLLNNWRIPSAEAWRAIALHDLIGMSVARGENLLPPYLYAKHPGFGITDVRRLYFPEHVNHSIYPVPGVNDGLPLLENDPADKANMAALRGAWQGAILTNPLDWLRHRLTFAGVFLGLTRPVFLPTQYGIEPNALGIQYVETRHGRLAMEAIAATARTVVAAPWLHYLAGSAAMLWLLVSRRAGLACITLAASGYAYLLGSLVVLPAADFRYHSWSFAAMLALVGVAFLAPHRKPA